MKLTDFLKTFLLTELTKGYLHHRFNKKENEHTLVDFLICSIMIQMEYLRIDEINSLSGTSL